MDPRVEILVHEVASEEGHKWSKIRRRIRNKNYAGSSAMFKEKAQTTAEALCKAKALARLFGYDSLFGVPVYWWREIAFV